jgi:uncharacterized damage-inducible protein DinB
VGRTLDALKRGAAGDENTMPLILDCVKAYCTVGEISDARSARRVRHLRRTGGLLTRDTGTRILGTMAHILGAEQVWLSRFVGAPLERLPSEQDYADLPALAAGFVDFWPQLEVFLASLADEQVRADLTWTSYSGETHTTPVHVALLHFVNHSTYHRGQVVSLMRQIGCEPPSTDLVYWRGRA